MGGTTQLVFLSWQSILRVGVASKTEFCLLENNATLARRTRVALGSANLNQAAGQRIMLQPRPPLTKKCILMQHAQLLKKIFKRFYLDRCSFLSKMYLCGHDVVRST